MAKKSNNQVEFPFFQYLRSFIETDSSKVYKAFSLLSKKFLDHNNPKKSPQAYLRQPQFEALEIYVFLKEFTNNKHLSEVFEDWFNKQNEFKGRTVMGLPRDAGGQINLFSVLEEDTNKDQQQFKEIFKQLSDVKQIYPNYIFALTMGLGKTVLMATTIFYEFLLANKYPKDERYCHNALVFAPDKTVLQSLREIQTFDLAKVVPQEYVIWLQTNVKFFFLDDTGDALNAIDHSSFNIIISNTQKIILKKEHKSKTPTQELFSTVSSLKLNQELLDLYGFEGDSEPDLIYNQRFAKLTKLKQLGVYVDEAHHVFGKALADDLFNFEKNTSLRFTINSLASMLKERGTKVVGCYNYTGTPYVGNRLLPEVVYSYGLQSAIDNKFLKKVKISGFENIKNQTQPFVKLVIKEFWERYGTERFEGMLPKIAFFASSIAELETELRPAIEKVLVEMNISTNKILVNVGDEKLTTNDDIREFNSLDSVRSEKQFILLVNKGKEGWNCRSLFGVALHREPKSKIFVLQATMRCLRKIGDSQETGLVFLSDENVKTLDEELKGNFRLTVEQLNNSGTDDDRVEVRLVPPPVKIKLKRSRKLHQIKPKELKEEIDLKLNEVETERYRIIRSERSIYDMSKKISKDEDVSDIKEKRCFSELTLTAEIARYLNQKPLEIKQILRSTKEGYEGILKSVNEFNELLYDYVIPHLFNELFDLIEYTNNEEIEIELVKSPKEGDCYKLKANRELLADMYDIRYSSFQNKSFHLDKYCFDSKPENQFFWTLLHDQKVEKVWFTGMLTHGQTDFVIHYIDPEQHTVRSYYPDFLIKKTDGNYLTLEVKGDNMINDAIVEAKSQAARQLASASNMTYQILKSSDVMRGGSYK